MSIVSPIPQYSRSSRLFQLFDMRLWAAQGWSLETWFRSRSRRLRVSVTNLFSKNMNTAMIFLSKSLLFSCFFVCCVCRYETTGIVRKNARNWRNFQFWSGDDIFWKFSKEFRKNPQIFKSQSRIFYEVSVWNFQPVSEVRSRLRRWAPYEMEQVSELNAWTSVKKKLSQKISKKTCSKYFCYDGLCNVWSRVHLYAWWKEKVFSNFAGKRDNRVQGDTDVFILF